jgi:hypothetical protein
MSVIEKLLIVQEKDCKIREKERELRDIPARQKAEEARLEGHRKELAAAEESVKSRMAGIKKLDLDVEAGRERITKLRRQQLEIKTNKEFRAIEEEIKTVGKEIAGVEDAQLAVMEELERLKADVERKKKALAAEQALVRTDVQELEKRAAVIQAELARETAERKDRAKDIAPEWLERYETIFARKDKALVPVEGGVCGGCHLQLAPYVAHSVRSQDHMVTCDFCGRLLYAV